MGRSVAVVSMLLMSSPCPSSVIMNWPLEHRRVSYTAVAQRSGTEKTYCFLYCSRSSTSDTSSGRRLLYFAIVPEQRLYWMVRRVIEPPSRRTAGSL